MIAIPGGTFLMGSDSQKPREGPVTRVTLSGFQLDRTEVTQSAYAACVAAGACSEPASGDDSSCDWRVPGTDNYPINCINWFQARAFCEWRGARLPTEAEWEFAARGQEERTYPWGEAAPDETRAQLFDIAVVGTHPAGATPLGLQDMAGNVWEWVEDVDSPHPGGSVTDPEAISPGTDEMTPRELANLDRLYRGGAYDDSEDQGLEGATRGHAIARFASGTTGVRCARGSAH
jgi:formylglycine-generating enzyme required for sulfatase activity